jgi:Kef-type K+ transport system membrane component KefB
MRLTEAQTFHLVAALLAMLLASQVLGGLFQRWRQPRVVGEILGGVLLGPMVLGAAWPAGHAFLFVHEPALLKPLGFAVWLGLLLLMFATGQESHDFHISGEWKTIAWLTSLGVLVPMLAGGLMPHLVDLSPFYGPAATSTSFGLIVALATAITAIPIIAKIFLDLGLTNTNFARVVLTVAFIEDVILWVVLALTLDIGQNAGKGPAALGLSMLATIVFFAACMGLGHRIYDRAARSRFWPLATAHPATGPVLVLLGIVLLAHGLGVNAIFGGFLAGRVVANAETVDQETQDQLRGLAFGLFIPVFFAGVGLRFDLRGQFDVGMFLAFLFFAVGVKVMATLVAGRLAGKPLRPSLHLAVALNARGAVGIVLATIAYDAQLISLSFYATLVLVALITSQAAGWWLHRVKEHRPEELDLTPRRVPEGVAAGI